MSNRITEAYNRVTGQDGQWTPEVVLEALTELDKSAYTEGAKFAAAHLATKMPTVEQIAEELKRHHFSGTECRTNGPGGCVQCFGPSPMSAEEIARVVRDLIAGADVTPAGPCPCACHEWPGGGNAHPHTKCRCHGGEGMSL